MTGFLCAVGIVGAMSFSIGWVSDEVDPVAWPLVFIGGGILVVAAIGGIVRLFV